MDYKHYIRIDSQDRIVAAFSDAFQAPQEGDILIAESDERHFHLDIIGPDGIYLHEYDGENIIPHVMTVDETVALAERRAEQKLASLDPKMVRGIDDLITTLIEKKIISESDLPDELVDRIEERKILRIK